MNTPAKTKEGLFLIECPNCGSLNIEDSGDDFDGEVNCNYCGLCTGICYGTESAIYIWNNRLKIERWYFLDLSMGDYTLLPGEYQI